MYYFIGVVNATKVHYNHDILEVVCGMWHVAFEPSFNIHHFIFHRWCFIRIGLCRMGFWWSSLWWFQNHSRFIIHYISNFILESFKKKLSICILLFILHPFNVYLFVSCCLSYTFSMYFFFWLFVFFYEFF